MRHGRVARFAVAFVLILTLAQSLPLADKLEEGRYSSSVGRLKHPADVPIFVPLPVPMAPSPLILFMVQVRFSSNGLVPIWGSWAPDAKLIPTAK